MSGLPTTGVAPATTDGIGTGHGRPSRAALLTQSAGIVGLAGLTTAVVAAADADPGTAGGPSAPVAGLVLVVGLVLAAYAWGFPEARATWARAGAAAATGAVIGAVAVVAADLLLTGPRLPVAVVVGSAALTAPWLILWGGVVTRRLPAGDRVLFVGSVAAARAVQDALAAHPERPATVVSVLPDEAAVVGADVLATAAPSLIVTESDATPTVGSIPVLSTGAFHERWLGKVLLTDVGALAREPATGPGYRSTKRAVDLVVATVGLVALGALIPLVALGNLLGNRGPLFYRQVRVGHREQPFRILKLRTMVSTPGPAEGADWQVDDHDPRITRFGRLLRASHLDELPQVVNVLRGELSIVGPRPSPLRYAADLLEHLPGYASRQSVLPGLTGWAQVKYGYAGDADGAREKLEYDLYYVAHRSLALDLRIIGRTTRTVLGVRGG